jgi:pimeloyl-ACP methyl ester carboxylesterase
MIRVHSALAAPSDRPPLVLVHGAASSGRVWILWQEELARHGWSSHALDLRGHGQSEPFDLAGARMADYAADVVRVAGAQRDRPVLVGWSMGGLVALMAAEACQARACVTLAPSAPAAASDASVPLRTGTFGPEEYGIVDRDPVRQPAMPDLDHEERLIALGALGQESRLARDERKAGIVVDRTGAPLLVVTGTADRQWPRERYRDLPLPADHLEVEGASHWGLVLNRRRLPGLVSAVVDWMTGVLSWSRRR